MVAIACETHCTGLRKLEAAEHFLGIERCVREEVSAEIGAVHVSIGQEVRQNAILQDGRTFRFTYRFNLGRESSR